MPTFNLPEPVKQLHDEIMELYPSHMENPWAYAAKLAEPKIAKQLVPIKKGVTPKVTPVSAEILDIYCHILAWCIRNDYRPLAQRVTVNNSVIIKIEKVLNYDPRGPRENELADYFYELAAAVRLAMPEGITPKAASSELIPSFPERKAATTIHRPNAPYTSAPMYQKWIAPDQDGVGENNSVYAIQKMLCSGMPNTDVEEEIKIKIEEPRDEPNSAEKEKVETRPSAIFDGRKNQAEEIKTKIKTPRCEAKKEKKEKVERKPSPSFDGSKKLTVGFSVTP